MATACLLDQFKIDDRSNFVLCLVIFKNLSPIPFQGVLYWALGFKCVDHSMCASKQGQIGHGWERIRFLEYVVSKCCFLPLSI